MGKRCFWCGRGMVGYLHVVPTAPHGLDVPKDCPGWSCHPDEYNDVMNQKMGERVVTPAWWVEGVE